MPMQHLAMVLIRKITNQGFGWAMLVALGMLFLGVYVAVKMESKFGWLLVVLAVVIGFVTMKQYGMM